MIRKLLAGAFALGALMGSAVAEEATVMIVTWRGCEDACRGFQDHLGEAGVAARFVLRDAAQREDAVPGFLAEAREMRADLILTWGTNVTRGVAGTLADRDDPTFNHDIPQVFTIVADPVGAGLVESLDDTGRANLTGTYNRVPEEVTIETIRAYKPDFRHLGLVYNANEANSVLKRDEMSALAERLGFAFTAVELPLRPDGKPHVEDIRPALASLAAAGVDFVYLGSSSFLQANADALTDAALAEGLPLLSPYERLVRESRALISVAARYYDVGRLAGAQAERILVHGAAPGDLPVARMRDFAVVINLAVARELRLFPPIELLQIAEIVDRPF